MVWSVYLATNLILLSQFWDRQMLFDLERVLNQSIENTIKPLPMWSININHVGIKV